MRAGGRLVLDVEAGLAQAAGQGRGQEALLAHLVVGRPRLGLPRARAERVLRAGGAGGRGAGMGAGGGPTGARGVRCRGGQGGGTGCGRGLLDDDAASGQGTEAVGVEAGDVLGGHFESFAAGWAAGVSIRWETWPTT